MSRKKLILCIICFLVMLSVKIVWDINEFQNEKYMSIVENTTSANTINIEFLDGVVRIIEGNSLKELGGFFEVGLILNAYKKDLKDAVVWAQIKYLNNNEILEEGQILVVDEKKLKEFPLGKIDGKPCVVYIDGTYFALGNSSNREILR